MQQNENNSRIEELKKSLYSRTAPDIRTRRKLRFGNTVTEIKTKWDQPEKDEITSTLNQKYEDHSMSFFAKLLIFSGIFCVIAVAVGVYIFLNGANLISANNIEIAFSGPVSVPGGTPVLFDITVTNKNNTDLQLADLSVSFPAGATDPNDPSKELTNYRELLGDIPAGGSVKRTVKAIIFAEENSQKQISAAVTYEVKGSSSSFTKEQTYDVLINSSPVILSLSSFKEITSGQEFDLKVDVKSNTANVLKGVLLSAIYPPGFTYISSDVKPSPDNTVWRLGDIPPGAERVVTVHGKLEGEDSDTKVFRFSVGASSSKNQNAIGTEYMKVTQEISIKKPFITVGISLDGDQGSADVVGQFNQPVHATVSWFNNLLSAVSDVEIRVKLSGSAYDKSLVQPGAGYFRSATDEIIWNQQTNPQLASIGAGESGEVSFTVTPRDASAQGRAVLNQILSFSASVAGRRTQETGVGETLTAIANRNSRIGTNVSLSGRVVRSTGPFTNSGPIPPKAEQKTTYTIVWAIDNTVNSVNNAKVTATLPPYVKWLDQVNPASEDVSFNKDSGMVTWNAGPIAAYTINSGQRKEVNFQISFEPSVNQVNNIPILVNEATLSGTDNFTNAVVHGSQNYLTTRFSTDPAYKEGQETVVK